MSNFISRLFSSASERYIQTENNGVLQLDFSDEPDLNHYYSFGESITYKNGNSESPTTIVKAPKYIFDCILEAPSIFDSRNDMYSEGVTISGDTSLLHCFTQLLKRPSDTTLRVLDTIDSIPVSDNIEVRVEEKISKELLDTVIKNSCPTVVRDGLTWPAVHWDVKTFKEKLGRYHLRKNIVTNENETLGDFVEQFEKGGNGRLYTNGCTLSDDVSRFFPFTFADQDKLGPVQLWFGNKRPSKPITKLHRDFGTSLLAQIWGRKKVILYPPWQADYLYPMKAFNMYQPCCVRVEQPDYDLFPKFKKAKPLEITVGPGDLLIIPTGWFHCVWALDDVLSIARFVEA